MQIRACENFKSTKEVLAAAEGKNLSNAMLVQLFSHHHADNIFIVPSE